MVGLFSRLGLAAALAFGLSSPAMMSERAIAIDVAPRTTTRRRKARRLAHSGWVRRRSRGAAAHPRRRTNRLHISRRVRRRNRRRAA